MATIYVAHSGHDLSHHLVKDAENVARYLRHLGLPTDAPPLAPARGPPFWQSTVLRRRYAIPFEAADA